MLKFQMLLDNAESQVTLGESLHPVPVMLSADMVEQSDTITEQYGHQVKRYFIQKQPGLL